MRVARQAPTAHDVGPETFRQRAASMRDSIQLSTGEALRLWHDVHLAMVRDDQPDLSARQLAVLLTVYLEAPPHTVRGLVDWKIK